MLTEDVLYQSRLKKLENLKKAGINPYPSESQRTHPLGVVGRRFEELSGHGVSVVGRIRSWREHGKSIFAHLEDESGRLQVYFKYDKLGEKSFSWLKNLDIGDFLEVEGEVFKTQTGEVTVLVKRWKLLAKSLRPLPEKWYGLQDLEKRYRHRYLDLLFNPEVKRRLLIKTQIVQAIRDFLTDRGFTEVETPIFQSLYGGARARPFVTHHNALDINLYLRISNELYLKRLIVGGFEKIFEFSYDFRNEGIDHKHNPEFLMMETMWAYANYEDNMRLTEEMLTYVANRVLGRSLFTYQGREIDLGKWERLSMVEAIARFTGAQFGGLKLKDAHALSQTLGVESVLPDDSFGMIIGKVFEEKVEGQIVEPTIVHDYPTATSPLAKRRADNPDFVERFEAFVMGAEYANAYSELNDPLDLAERFQVEAKLAKEGDAEAHPTDLEFIRAVEHGLPPVSGVGIGIDRLAMLLSDTDNIKEVIAFPLLRPEKEEGVRVEGEEAAQFCQIEVGVRKRFPGIHVGVGILEGGRIYPTLPELEEYAREVLGPFEGLSVETIGKRKEIRAYRKLYALTGVDFHSRRPGPEALLRRIALGKGLPRVNSAVDAVNLAVVQTSVSSGIFDAEKVKFPVVLRFSPGREDILLLGDKLPTVTQKGELVYADAEGILNLDFNWRDATRTKVTTDSSRLLVFVDGVEDLPGLESEDEVGPVKVKKMLELVLGLLSKFTGAKITHKFFL